MNTTRRAFLGGLAAVSAPVAAISGEPPDEALTRLDLVHYYAFLWAEHCAVAELLGVPEFDTMLVHRSGGIRIYNSADRGQIHCRAKIILQHAV